MKTPLISIIVPAYNVESYISNALDSILAQTYTKIEIIVVNDGSKDRTRTIIDHYASIDNRIKAIHKENGGVTSARLRGVSEAAGEWIGFVDGDDYIEPQMYERLLKNALEFDVDISHCGYQMVFNNRVDYYYNTGRLIHQNHAQAISDLLQGKFIEPGLVNKLFNRKLFCALSNRIDQSIKINEDLLMNYWLFTAADSAIFEDICPYHYLVHKGSAANSALNRHHLYDPLRVTRIIKDNAEQEFQPILLERLCRQLISGATMSLMKQAELIHPFRKKCRSELRSILREIIFSSCGLRLKAMTIWATIWPSSYCFIHTAYIKLTGLDKKYDLG